MTSTQCNLVLVYHAQDVDDLRSVGRNTLKDDVLGLLTGLEDRQVILKDLVLLVLL